jgi:hypothetical protein
MNSFLENLIALTSESALTGDRQNALTQILSHLATTPMQGRPFILSPGEIRGAIYRASGGEEVLNYEHSLLPDPVVSCASKDQLKGELARRFYVGDL